MDIVSRNALVGKDMITLLRAFSPRAHVSMSERDGSIVARWGDLAWGNAAPAPERLRTRWPLEEKHKSSTLSYPLRGTIATMLAVDATRGISQFHLSSDA